MQRYRRRPLFVEAEPDGRGYYVRRIDAEGKPGFGAGWVSREEFMRDYEPVVEWSAIRALLSGDSEGEK
jgi:hypothetical protein